MVKRIERNRNTTDAPTVADGIPTVDNNAITIAVANPRRTEITVTVRDENGWIRAIPASTDPTVRKGVFRHAGGSKTFSGDDVVTSEFSGINDKNGKTPVFYVTEN